MKSPFEAIKQTDEAGREWWNSRQLGVTSADISYHLIQIETNGELHLSDCIKKNLIPSEQWDEQGVTLYNLDAVIMFLYS